ncbi:hypothetical protein PMAYCL1PPCAC_19989, partial [Pristionchus mayeri]
HLRKSNYNIDPHGSITVDDCINGHSKLGINYGVAPPRQKPPGMFPGKCKPLGVHIRDRIKFGPPPWIAERKVNHPPPKMWILLDIIHAIEYLKTFVFFHKIPASDKIALAKNVTLMTAYITNSFKAFQSKSDVTVHADGCIPGGGQMLEWVHLPEAREEVELHYETVQRVKQLNLDKREYVLIKALIACNPAIEDLSSRSRSIMQEQRDRYAKSLMSYVMARRGMIEGPHIYSEIMSHVEWLTRLAKKQKDMYVLICALGLRNDKMAPLMDEILGS